MAVLREKDDDFLRDGLSDKGAELPLNYVFQKENYKLFPTGLATQVTANVQRTGDSRRITRILLGDD